MICGGIDAVTKMLNKNNKQLWFNKVTNVRMVYKSFKLFPQKIYWKL